MANKTGSLKEGTVLDERFVIGEVIGSGGFGITYKGENRRLGMPVAIKEFFCREYMTRNTDVSDTVEVDADSRERFVKEKERFLKEARALRDFSGEDGVVQVLDYFDENGTAYIVMRHIDGITLWEYVKRNGRMEPEMLFRKMKPLMKTLERIHKSGIVHRDISPDNIMILEDGSLCLIDFGAAYRYSEDTKSYVVLSKAGYSAPEQYRKDGKIGPASDVYSLCATIWFCLTGTDPQDSLQRILLDEQEKPSSYGIDVPEDTEKLLVRGMALAEKDRLGDIGEMLDAVGKIYPDETKDVPSRRPLYVILGVALAAAVFAAVIGGIWYSGNRVRLRLRSMDTETVYLKTNEGMSVQNYQQAVSVIKERLKVFAGKDNYLLSETEEGLRLEFPKELLCGLDPEYAVRFYITRPGKWYFYKEYPNTVTAEDALRLTTEDFALLEERTGDIEGAERERPAIPSEGDLRYVHVELTSEALKKAEDILGEALAEKGARIYNFFDADREGIRHYGCYAYSCGDGKSFDAVVRDDKGTFPDTFYYNLTNEGTAETFGVAAYWIVNWEDVYAASLTAIRGENQVNENEIEEECVLLWYRNAYYADSERSPKENKADWFHDVIVLKERLDVLGVPYAFGEMAYADGSVIIKLPKTEATQYNTDMLGAYYSVTAGSIWNLSAFYTLL